MNGYTTPQEYIAQAEACLATAKEELAKARAAQARARVWIALIENALAQDKLTQDMNAAEECDFHDSDSRDPLACTCDESTI
jgi:hypothetical protein